MNRPSTDAVAGFPRHGDRPRRRGRGCSRRRPSLAADTCSARSAATVPPVVELYTSEGCNSCPPADRWLSKLKADPDVVALAFHVDYWDRLGWKDRFASAAFTARQAEQQASNGARFSYTPQVVVDGQDRKDWPGIAMPLGNRPAAPVDVLLAREGDRVTATVAAGARSPKRLAAYWAVTEQGHVTAVKAGENQGVTLQHDYVVRDYQTVPAVVGTAAVQRRPSPSSCRRGPMRRRVRARSTWSSSMPTAAGPVQAAEDRLLTRRDQSAARSFARSSAPIWGLSAKGSLGLRASRRRRRASSGRGRGRRGG